VAGGTLPVPYYLAKVGTKAKPRQPNQQEGAKKANSPQFKHIGRGGQAGSRKYLVAPILYFFCKTL